MYGIDYVFFLNIDFSYSTPNPKLTTLINLFVYRALWKLEFQEM